MDWLPDGWKPKLVAVDIDGTLTDGNKVLNLEAIEALRKLEKAGIPVTLATGNVRPITYGLWRFIGLSGPMCCENGGVIWHPDWGEPILRAKAETAKEAASYLAQKMPELREKGIRSNDWRESEWCLFPNEDLETIKELMSDEKWSHLEVVRTGFAIHLMEPQLSKGEGLKVILDKMGITERDLLVVGDAPNDISMFELANWSVAVGGAFEEIKNLADVESPYMHGDTFKPLVDAILS